MLCHASPADGIASAVVTEVIHWRLAAEWPSVVERAGLADPRVWSSDAGIGVPENHLLITGVA